MRINRIKFITEMAKRDLTIKALSEKSGISRTTLTNVKSGKSCSLDTGQAIARALGVSTEDILEEV